MTAATLFELTRALGLRLRLEAVKEHTDYASSCGVEERHGVR